MLDVESDEIHQIGLGAAASRLRFYIANRPGFADYPRLEQLRPLLPGEVQQIVANTSNHWRKLFNVYAKLLFDWYQQTDKRFNSSRWQAYREQVLFQSHSCEALLFSQPHLESGENCLHIIAGKTYAASLDLPPLEWLDNYFAINRQHRLIVAPYPDYRQLSNARIAQLLALMAELK